MKNKIIKEILKEKLEGYKYLITDAEIEIVVRWLFENGYDLNKWINVNDKLPKEGELVLVWKESDIMPESYDPATGAYSFFSDGVWGNEENDDWNVTHWMPVPEPPKTE